MDDESARRLLAQSRERVEKLLAGDPDDPPEEEVEEGVAERLRQELDDIERAERRLAEGTYGRSIESGEPIPDARLEAIPWAERTAEEQERFERGG
jgi:DnaK suppressor protein